jgi:ATP adenylyltransferase
MTERLWSPWRMEYIRAPHPEDDADTGGCIFCQKPLEGDDGAAYIVARSDRSFVVLNKYPYNPGHLMVAPYRHIADLTELAEDEMLDAGRLLQRSVVALRALGDPQGFNIGMNLGRVAGAGIPGHLHWHVVPRWNGDTNFMPVLGETRVLPELLAETYARLQPLY